MLNSRANIFHYIDCKLAAGRKKKLSTGDKFNYENFLQNYKLHPVKPKCVRIACQYACKVHAICKTFPAESF